MNTIRIAALLEPFLEEPLSQLQLEQISMYIDLLQRWNSRINLTAIRKEEEIVTRHFGESFFMAQRVLPPPTRADPERSNRFAKNEAAAKSKDLVSSQATPQATIQANMEPPANPSRPSPTVLDVGSGAGFPGLPLKLWAPEIKLTLIESNQKKATFLREAVRALILTDVNVISERAEALASDPSFPRTKLVTLRAVERFEKILSQAISLAESHGTVALLLGARQIAALDTTLVDWQPPIPIPQSHARVLSIGVRR